MMRVLLFLALLVSAGAFAQPYGPGPTGGSGGTVTSLPNPSVFGVTCSVATATITPAITCTAGSPVMGTASATSVALTGGTVTGVPTPSAGTDAANKSYVDNIAAGLNPAIAAAAGTTTVLPNSPTYSNGVSGIGATLTAGSAAVLVIDGYTVLLNDRVLVKNQGSSFQNGVYVLSTLGTGIIPYVLTRASDYNQPSDMNNTGAIPVINGTSNATTTWVLTSTIATVGTDAVVFTQYTLNPSTIVTGPGSATDGHFAIFSGSTGKLLKDTLASPGTAATVNTGTSGATIPLLNGANTWSGTQTFSTIGGYIATVTTQSGTTYTLAGTDCGTFVRFTNAGAITVTLPNSLAIGCQIAMQQDAAGQITLSAASGATFHSAHSYTKTFGQYSVVGVTVTTNGGGTTANYIMTGDGA